MSVPSLGFNNTGSNTPPSLSSQILMSSTTSPAIQSITTSCCENGRPIMTDPHTGQSICSCQYGSSLLSAYSRVPGLTDSMYSSPHYTTQGYMSLNSADPSAFYSPLNAHYDSLKDNAESAWRSISQPTACYPYDPTMAAYPYGNTYGGMDLNGAARRKNATRETTNTLKAWLYEHRKNPYPTKGEKIMLAIITKMTLTQVSTWFANARRRLKKENKMTWSPRNRCADDEDDSADKNDDDSNDDKDDADKNEERAVGKNKDDKDIDLKPPFSPLEELKKPEFPLSPDTISMDKPVDKSLNMQNDPLIVSPLSHDLTSLQSDLKRLESPCSNSSDSGLSDINSTLSANGHNTDPADSLRPRIWSIANVVTSISGNVPNTSHPDSKDQSLNLNLSKVPSYVHSSSTMRPWIDSSFNVGSSIFTPMPSYNNSTGTPRFKDGNQPNHGMSSVNGFSTPSLARPYSSVSSLYSPVRDLSKRGMDKLSDLCS